MHRRYLIFAVILSLVLPVFLIGCADKPGEEIIVRNIVRVFWHEYNRYSVMTREPGSREIKTVNFARYARKVVIIADVRPYESMWARVIPIKGKDLDYWVELVEIHIRTEKDVEGGGWNHGKHGSGSTHVIQ